MKHFGSSMPPRKLDKHEQRLCKEEKRVWTENKQQEPPQTIENVNRAYILHALHTYRRGLVAT